MGAFLPFCLSGWACLGDFSQGDLRGDMFLGKGGRLAGMEFLVFIVLISGVITHSCIYVWLSLGLHCFHCFLILGAKFSRSGCRQQA